MRIEYKPPLTESENEGRVAPCHGKRMVLVFLLAITLSAAQEFTTTPGPVAMRQPSFGGCALEATGGAALGALGFGCGLAVALGYGGIDEGRDRGAVAIVLGVSPVLAVIGCAGGTCIVGSALKQDGRFLPTLAYTAGTGVLAYGLLLGGQTMLSGPWGYHGVIGWSMIGFGCGRNDNDAARGRVRLQPLTPAPHLWQPLCALLDYAGIRQ